MSKVNEYLAVLAVALGLGVATLVFLIIVLETIKVIYL